eukprot:2689218-Prymnesium_polylepis.1
MQINLTYAQRRARQRQSASGRLVSMTPPGLPRVLLAQVPSPHGPRVPSRGPHVCRLAALTRHWPTGAALAMPPSPFHPHRAALTVPPSPFHPHRAALTVPPSPCRPH